MFYQMNSFMLANELIQYFRNTSIARAVKQLIFREVLGGGGTLRRQSPTQWHHRRDNCDSFEKKEVKFVK